jgi:hypothetical protein
MIADSSAHEIPIFHNCQEPPAIYNWTQSTLSNSPVPFGSTILCSGNASGSGGSGNGSPEVLLLPVGSAKHGPRKSAKNPYSQTKSNFYTDVQLPPSEGINNDSN